MQLLCNAGADLLNRRDGVGGWPALTIAAGEGHLEVARFLCTAGADLSERVHQEAATLMMAAAQGHLEVVRFLCDAEADLSDSRDGGMSLMIAATNGNLKVVRLLCDVGADLSDRDCDGRTAVMIAAHKGQLEVVRLLCDAGADFSDRYPFRWTALMMTAEQGHWKTVLCLVEAGADIRSTEDNEGFTPSKVAAYEGHTDVVQELISAVANVNQSSTALEPKHAGKTALPPCLLSWKAIQKGSQGQHFFEGCLNAMFANSGTGVPRFFLAVAHRDGYRDSR